MLNSAFKLVPTGFAVANSTASEVSSDVLPICPYHNQIIFAKSARDTLVESQGLIDLQDFFVRKQILDYKKAVGIEEVIYKEDMTSFFAGITRIARVVPDYIHLIKLLFQSEAFPMLGSLTKELITSVNPGVFGMKAFTTYQRVQRLYSEGDYEKAGRVLVNGILDDHQMQTEASVSWYALPYDEGSSYPGEDIAGYMAGLIYHFVGEEDLNTDNLAACVGSQKGLKENFSEAIDSLNKRKNDDVSVGIAHLNAIFLGLDSYVADCSDQTKEQVQKIQEVARSAGTLDEAAIVANL